MASNQSPQVMAKISSMIINRLRNGDLYKPWLWPWLLLEKISRPVHPGVFLLNLIVQRIFRVNAGQKFMVHFTSYVSGHIQAGKDVNISFASSGGCYIQGENGISIGDGTIFAPGVKIISANHDAGNYSKWIEVQGVSIGKNCWIGANAVILPQVTLGNNVIVGAGAVVTRSFPDNSVLAGVPAKLIRQKE